MLLMYPEHRKKAFDEELVSEDDFITELNRRVFSYIKQAYTEGDDSHHDIDAQFTPDECGRITRMKLSRMQLDNNGTDVLLESIDLLKKSLEKKKAVSAETINDLEQLINSIRNKN